LDPGKYLQAKAGSVIFPRLTVQQMLNQQSESRDESKPSTSHHQQSDSRDESKPSTYHHQQSDTEKMTL